MHADRRICNYRAGAGSNTITVISESSAWRTALLGTVAAGSLWLYSTRVARAGPDACAIAGTSPNQTVTCQGNQSQGINGAGAVPPNFNQATTTTLNVNTLTTNITPASGVDGIHFVRLGIGQDIIINSDTTPFSISVYGAGADGIQAETPGTITITHTGDITSNDGRGIFANGSGGVDIDLYGNVDASTFGIAAYNSGGGALSIIANGDVAGAGANSTGILALQSDAAATGPLSITSEGKVTGGQFGIEARNFGTGALEIVANGDVVGTTAGSVGIYAITYTITPNTDLSITTGIGTAVTGDYRGIVAHHNGNEDLIITANGDVTGTTDTAIYARSTVRGNDLTVTTGRGTSVTGGVFGIDARTFSTGALEITANGDVAGITGTGIYARQGNTAATGPLSIATERSVTGGTYGIDARNYGLGATEIVVNGDVAGTTRDGIYAKNYGVDLVTGKSLGITTEGKVTGGLYGIRARNYGAGALSIVANGDVEGTGNIGIYARSSGNTDGMSLSIVSEAMVTGGLRGIFARNYGTGALTIDANDHVEGGYIGIYARNNNGVDPDTGVSLSIATQGVTGGYYGIYATNFGTGASSIVANGDVEATSAISTGIYALIHSVAATGPLSITTEGVSGGAYGIRARNYGLGATEIVVNGDVAGTTRDGISVHVENSLAPVSITTHGKVTGGLLGIDALTFGGGVLTIVANGDVTGTSSAGIRAAAAGSAPANVTVGAGATVLGGAVGVVFEGGGSGTLTNFGRIANLSGVTGDAVGGSSGDDTVNNFGVVTGSVILTTGNNAFNNMAGGLFNSGVTVNLGDGNLLTNNGTLSPGGAGNILTTELTGNFQQPGSQLEVDLLGASADRLAIQEDAGTAALAGTVKPLFTLSGLGSFTRWTVLTTPLEPIQDNGIEAVSTAAVTFGLDFPTDTQMDLVLLGVNFAPSGLNNNQTAIGNNLTEIYENGSGGLVSLLDALAALPKIGDLANALNHLSPEIYLDTEIATLFAAQNFTSSLMTCPVRDGATAFIKEGQCVWGRISGRDFTQDATFQTLGFDERSFEVAGGLQGALGDVWRVGFAGAYERSKLDTDPLASSDADRIHGGAVLKYNPGALLLAGAVSGGWGWYDTERQIAFPGFLALAQSEHDVGHVNGRLRAAYQLGSGTWYAKPMVDLDATHVSLDGVDESGAGGAGLNVRGNDETVLSATPALELGAQFGGPSGTLMRPYVRGGASFYDDPDFVLLASFDGAPSGVGPFRIATATDDVVGNVGAGVDVIGTEGASFRLYYEGRFSDLVEQHAGGIKGTLPF